MSVITPNTSNPVTITDGFTNVVTVGQQPMALSLPVTISSDQSILNVNVVNPNAPTLVNVNYYTEVSSVATNVPTIILTYTVPSTLTGFYFNLAEVSGTQIANFRVYIDGIRMAKKSTYWGSGFNSDFNFLGFKLNVGQIITIEVLNGQSDLGDFNSRIIGSLI